MGKRKEKKRREKESKKKKGKKRKKKKKKRKERKKRKDKKRKEKKKRKQTSQPKTFFFPIHTIMNSSSNNFLNQILRICSMNALSKRVSSVGHSSSSFFSFLFFFFFSFFFSFFLFFSFLLWSLCQSERLLSVFLFSFLWFSKQKRNLRII